MSKLAMMASAGVIVGPEGLWFQLPGAPVVDLERWPSLQKILRRLAEERRLHPGRPVPVTAIVEAGWPGERMRAAAGSTRVYTALSTLRRLGLRDVLVRAPGGGYLLMPEAS